MSHRRSRTAVPAAAPVPGTPVVGYVRVSTDQQASEGQSLEAQQARITAYAALYRLHLVAIEVDAGRTAKSGSLHRPALSRALASIQTGVAAGIIVVKLDRLTRSLRDLDVLLSGPLQNRVLISVTEQIDTRTPSGRLVLNILTSVAQWEREATGDRTAAAMDHLAARGRYTGGDAPYGYARPAGSGANDLIPVPAELAAIQLARTLRGEGLALRAIGVRLTEAGYRPRSGAAAWHPTTVSGLLVDEGRPVPHPDLPTG